MVLSGVARTEARFPCGKNLIAQMLCGSGNAKMSKLRLDKLSTFGLLKHLRQPDVTLMIDALVALRCLEQVEPEPFRPVVQLTEFGREVMKGHATLDVALPLPLELLRKLKAGRKGEGKNGKGEGRRRKGENGTTGRHAEAAAEGQQGTGAATKSQNSTVEHSVIDPRHFPPAVHPSSSAPISHPSHYWTWRLLSAGFSVEECASIRGLSCETILEHARQAQRELEANGP
jgi:superfamily II DNA helicase RecQ